MKYTSLLLSLSTSCFHHTGDHCAHQVHVSSSLSTSCFHHTGDHSVHPSTSLSLPFNVMLPSYWRSQCTSSTRLSLPFNVTRGHSVHQVLSLPFNVMLPSYSWSQCTSSILPPFQRHASIILVVTVYIKYSPSLSTSCFHHTRGHSVHQVFSLPFNVMLPSYSWSQCTSSTRLSPCPFQRHVSIMLVVIVYIKYTSLPNFERHVSIILVVTVNIKYTTLSLPFNVMLPSYW